MKSYFFLLCVLMMLTGYSEEPADTSPLEFGVPRKSPGMITLSSSSGMPHGGYYNLYGTIYEVSTNVFAATPAWMPSSGQPIPLDAHEAYAIYLKWRETLPEDVDWKPERIVLSSKELPGERYGDENAERRWYYTITQNFGQRIIVLLDGTLVTPRVVDLRTDDQKKEYEEMVRKRKERAQNCACGNDCTP